MTVLRMTSELLTTTERKSGESSQPITKPSHRLEEGNRGDDDEGKEVKRGTRKKVGRYTFYVSRKGEGKVTGMGLPTGLATCEILARGEELKAISHPHLCQQLECFLGRFGQVTLLSEHHPLSLSDLLNSISQQQLPGPTESLLRKLIGPMVTAVVALTSMGSDLKLRLIAVGNLEPRHVLMVTDAQGDTLPSDWETLVTQCTLKLSQFGLGYLTRYGQRINFPFSYSQYTAPEVLLFQTWWGHQSSQSNTEEENPPPTTTATLLPFDARADTWSLGLIIAELMLGTHLLSDFLKETQGIHPDPSTEEYFLAVTSLAVPGPTATSFKAFVRHHLTQTSANPGGTWRQFIELALEPVVAERCYPESLLEHPFLKSHYPTARVEPHPTFSDRVKDLSLEELRARRAGWDDELSLKEIVYLWQLSGGKLEGSTNPTIETLPRGVLKRSSHHEELDGHHPSESPFTNNISLIPLDHLTPLIEESHHLPRQYPPLDPSSRVVSPPRQLDLVFRPLPVTEPSDGLALHRREKDFGYQCRRIRMFRRLLAQYPASQEELRYHAQWDIPPLLRGPIWAALLGVKGDYHRAYHEACVSQSEHSQQTDRQIDVDVPRCHQYHPLLASQKGQERLRSVLKAWVATNEGLVYWQGLDSLCAPFLVLNFNDEALAFACLQRLIPQHLSSLFLPDNAPGLQNKLQAFHHLLAFHDPQLALYTHSLGFHPQLYAIPWFLTLFTHAFSLDKTFLLWDRFLAGPPALPLFTAVAIVHQLRKTILTSDFNQCILLFSESFPELDVELGLTTALQFYEATPTSVLEILMAAPGHLADQASSVTWKLSSDWDQVPPLSGEDFYRWRSQLLVVDVRSFNEYVEGHHTQSLHVMVPADRRDQFQDLLHPITRQIQGWPLLVVVGDSDETALQFGLTLTHLALPRVVLLPSDLHHLLLSAPASSSSPPLQCHCDPSRFIVPRLELNSPALSIHKCRQFRPPPTPRSSHARSQSRPHP